MAKNIKAIGIHNLLLDTENARYGGETVASQREAMEKMFQIKEMEKKIFNLASDIAKNGLDPSELPLAVPIKMERGVNSQNYYLVEGNRRLLAIKLLHDPNLSLSDSYRIKIKDLTSPKLKRSLAEVQCSILNSRETADWWVSLKHTGENEGKGRVSWDGRATDAHRVRTGKNKPVGRQILDYIEADKFFSTNIKSKIKKIKITNLTRFFQGSPAKKAFGLAQKKGFLESSTPLEDLREIIECVAENMLDRDFSVKNIYHKKDQENFIKDKIPIEILPASESFLDKNKTWQLSSLDVSKLTGEQKTSNKKKTGSSSKKSPRSKPRSADRDRLIDFSLKINDKRINEIYYELKEKLDVFDSPNAVSVLFRVFLELTCDWYIEKNGLKRTDDKKPLSRNNSPLKVKVQHIADALEEGDLLGKQQASAIQKSASSTDELISINALNDYIHARELSPLPRELNKTMDNWAPLFKAIWE